MGTEIGSENPPVALAKIRDRLFEEPWCFQFFQAVPPAGTHPPGRSPVGRYANPADEAVRFRAHPSLAFPPSQISALEERESGPPVMDLNFFGLIGPSGALPTFITELVISRNRARDATLGAFLDIFNHRLTSFFYQAWEKYPFPVAYERNQDDAVTSALMALSGFGLPALRNRQSVPDGTFIYYGGIYGLAPRSAAALEAVIGDYFDVPVEIVLIRGLALIGSQLTSASSTTSHWTNPPCSDWVRLWEMRCGISSHAYALSSARYPANATVSSPNRHRLATITGSDANLLWQE